MNTEKAEMLREIAIEFNSDEPAHQFLLSIADEMENKTNPRGDLQKYGPATYWPLCDKQDSNEESKPLELSVEKCPTCSAPVTISWSGLELVENTGDETLAQKHYKFDRSRVRVDLERFGVALLEWDWRNGFNTNYTAAEGVKRFLQSSDFEKLNMK